MNFKKHLCFLLTSFLLVSNLGLAFNVHYCGNEITSVSISKGSSSEEAEKDCCGPVEKDSKCCKNKIIKSEIKSDQIVSKSLSFETNYIVVVYNNWNPIVFATEFNFKSRDTITYYCDTHSPPIYLLYSQFTFYA